MKRLHVSMAQHKKAIFQFFPPRLTVDAVIIQDKKVLLMKRDIPPFRGYWVMPGGHVEIGEHPAKTVIREVREEVGVRVRVDSLVGAFLPIDPRGYCVTLVYRCTILSGTPRSASFESCGFQWFSLKKLPRKIGFGHRPCIRAAIR